MLKSSSIYTGSKSYRLNSLKGVAYGDYAGFRVQGLNSSSTGGYIGDNVVKVWYGALREKLGV